MSSNLLGWSTPVMWAPRALKICTAFEPTLPPAPLTSTRRPGRKSPHAGRFIIMMTPNVVTLAACSKETRVGLSWMVSAGTAAYHRKYHRCPTASSAC